MRLIDADAIDFAFPLPDNLEGMLKQIGIEMAKIRVSLASTIEAEPVRHGRWIKKVESYHDSHTDEYWDEEYCSCPFCGKDSDSEHNYCPNCGAKMDGGGGDDQA